MNAIDIAILIPVLWGFWRGFMKGAIMEAATLVAFFLAVWGGMHLSDEVEKLIFTWTGSTSPYVPLISFAVIFVAILAVVFSVAKLVEKVVEKSALTIVNKLLGGAIGTVKFLLVLSVLFFVIDKLEKNIEIIPSVMKDKSLLYRPVAKVAPMIIPGMSESKLGKFVPETDLIESRDSLVK